MMYGMLLFTSQVPSNTLPSIQLSMMNTNLNFALIFPLFFYINTHTYTHFNFLLKYIHIEMHTRHRNSQLVTLQQTPETSPLLLPRRENYTTQVLTL